MPFTMRRRIETRLASEQGFTLIELLVVMLILSIMSGIAVPQYMLYARKAKITASQANTRSGVTAAEAWAENTTGGNGSYAGLTGAAIRHASPGVSQGVKAVGVNSGAGYCVQDSEPGSPYTYAYVGGKPGAAVPAANIGILLASTCVAVVSSPAT